jgi:hypothetical protein
MAEKTKGRSQHRGKRRCSNGQVEGGDAFEQLRVNTDENVVKWIFQRGPDLTWRWRKTSTAQGVMAECTDSFSSYCDCMTDAQSHGYRQWLAPAKLMPLSFSHVPGTLKKEEGKEHRASPDSNAAKGTPAQANEVALCPTGPKVVSLRRKETS